MHGPYGIVIRFRKPEGLTDADVEGPTVEAHRFYKTLPGFRSAMYFNIDEEEYTAAVSFFTEETADSALEVIRGRVLAVLPHASVVKSEVVPGESIDEFIATGGKVRR